MSDHPQPSAFEGSGVPSGRSGGMMGADSEDDDVLMAAKAQSGRIVEAILVLRERLDANYALHAAVSQKTHDAVKQLSSEVTLAREDLQALGGKVAVLGQMQELTTGGLKDVNDRLSSLNDTVTAGFSSLRESMDAKVDHARKESHSLTNEVRDEVKTIKRTQGTWLRITEFVEKNEKKAQWLAFIVIAFGSAILNKACQ